MPQHSEDRVLLGLSSQQRPIDLERWRPGCEPGQLARDDAGHTGEEDGRVIHNSDFRARELAGVRLGRRRGMRGTHHAAALAYGGAIRPVSLLAVGAGGWARRAHPGGHGPTLDSTQRGRGDPARKGNQQQGGDGACLHPGETLRPSPRELQQKRAALQPRLSGKRPSGSSPALPACQARFRSFTSW